MHKNRGRLKNDLGRFILSLVPLRTEEIADRLGRSKQTIENWIYKRSGGVPKLIDAINLAAFLSEETGEDPDLLLLEIFRTQKQYQKLLQQYEDRKNAK